jgi:hypothetical protein
VVSLDILFAVNAVQDFTFDNTVSFAKVTLDLILIADSETNMISGDCT